MENECTLVLSVVALSSLRLGEVVCCFSWHWVTVPLSSYGEWAVAWSGQADIQCPKLFLIVSHTVTQRARSAVLSQLLRTLTQWRCGSFHKWIFAQDFLAVGLISLCMLNREDAYEHGANELRTVSNCCAVGKLFAVLAQVLLGLSDLWRWSEIRFQIEVFKTSLQRNQLLELSGAWRQWCYPGRCCVGYHPQVSFTSLRQSSTVPLFQKWPLWGFCSCGFSCQSRAFCFTCLDLWVPPQLF